MRWTKVEQTDRHGRGPARPISQPFCACLWGRGKGEMINTIFFKTCLLIEAMVNWLTKLSINVFNEVEAILNNLLSRYFKLNSQISTKEG